MSFIQQTKADRDNKYLDKYWSQQNKATGFVNPADDFAGHGLDLNQRYISSPASTYFLFASDNNLAKYGINRDDLLIVDRSLPVKSGKFAVIVCYGDMKLSLLTQELIAKFSQIDYEYWGTVTSVIRSV